MSAKKPSIFISSTIHDFRDLRSALRHYLASLGFDVLLSEFNDFPKQLDTNAFQAALQTIQSADYFILLVGPRVGTMYDETQGISVTRQEYRTAYELATQARMRLALFVRREIWDLRADRDALRGFLLQDFARFKELTPTEVEKILHHPGPLANEPALLFDFLNEIARVEETQAAVLHKGDFPPANWIHTFVTFEDILDALRVHLQLATPLSTIALRANLRREILENLRLISTKFEGKISPSYTWAQAARKHITGGMHDHSRMPGRYFRWTLVYSLMVFRGANMSSRFVDQALETGQFLEYNPDKGEYVSGSLNERLLQLSERIRGLRSSVELFRRTLTEFITKYKDAAKTEADIEVPNEDLLWPLALADLEQDIVHLSIALIRALAGDARWLPVIELNPPTPFAEEAERIAKEAATLNDVERWIRSQVGEGYE